MIRVGTATVKRRAGKMATIMVPLAWMEKNGLTVGDKVHFGVSLDGTMRYHVEGNVYRKPLSLTAAHNQAYVIVPTKECRKQGIEIGDVLNLAIDNNGALVVRNA